MPCDGELALRVTRYEPLVYFCSCWAASSRTRDLHQRACSFRGQFATTHDALWLNLASKSLYDLSSSDNSFCATAIGGCSVASVEYRESSIIRIDGSHVNFESEPGRSLQRRAAIRDARDSADRGQVYACACISTFGDETSGSLPAFRCDYRSLAFGYPPVGP